MADWPTEFFDGELEKKAKEYLAAKSKNAAEKIFKDATQKTAQKIVKNPRVLLRLPMQRIQGLLARFSISAAQREAGMAVLRQGTLWVARGVVVAAPYVVAIAGVLVACVVVGVLLAALINFLGDLGRDKTPHNSTQEWLEDSYKQHLGHPPLFINGAIG